MAFLSGTKVERQRARRYLGWLLKQRSGGVRIDDVADMNDVTVVHVPQNCMVCCTLVAGALLLRASAALSDPFGSSMRPNQSCFYTTGVLTSQ